MHVPEKDRGKFSVRSLVCTFLGFAEALKASRLTSWFTAQVAGSVSRATLYSMKGAHHRASSA